MLSSRSLLTIYFIYCSVYVRRRQWQPTPVLLPGKSHGWSSLVGCSPWGREESDTTDQLHFHFSLSCVGEGHGNPLQYSCLENTRDRGAWWDAIYGVAQSRTRLKWLSSSSSKLSCWKPTHWKHLLGMTWFPNCCTYFFVWPFCCLLLFFFFPSLPHSLLI